MLVDAQIGHRIAVTDAQIAGGLCVSDAVVNGLLIEQAIFNYAIAFIYAWDYFAEDYAE